MDVLLLSILYVTLQLVFVTFHYLSTEVPLMYDMRRYHIFEYNKHKNRMIILFFATTASLILVIIFNISLLYLWTCSYELFTKGIKGVDTAMFNLTSYDESLCTVFVSYY